MEEIWKIVRESGVEYAILCEETCPRTLKKHLHLFGRYAKKRRLTAIGKLFGCHIEYIKRHPQTGEFMYYEAQEYCRKDGLYKEFGIPEPEAPREVKQCPFVACINLAKDGRLDRIRDEYPKMFVLHLTKWKIIAGEEQSKDMFPNRKCLWIRGKSGIGKSRWVSTNCPDAYRKNANEEHFERYQNEDIVVIEDIMPDHRKMWNHHMLMISDIYPYMPKIRYGSVCLKHNLLVVTSNYSIEEVFPHDSSRGKSPWQRRFIEVTAVEWDDKREDLIVLNPNPLTPFDLTYTLIGYLLFHYHFCFN